MVTVPTALLLATIWAIHARHTKRGAAQAVMPLAAVAVLAATALGGAAAVLAAGLVCAATVGTGLFLHTRERPTVPAG